MTAERPGALAFAWVGALLFASSLVIFLHAYFVAFGRPAPDEPALPNVLTNIGLFTVFALHHSVLARSGVKARMARLVPEVLERAIYTWTASLLLIGVCLLWRPVAGELYRLEAPLAMVCFAMQIAAIVMTILCSSALGFLDLAGVRRVLDARRGEAPPHPALLTSGLYGFVRHPLYFAWFILVFATPHMTMTRFVFAVVSTLYLAVAIPFEERSLIGVFGEAYRGYQRDVRWRMVPWVY